MTDTKNIEINKHSFDKKNLLVIVLSFVLLIVIGLFIWQRSEHKSVVSELNIEKDSIRYELENIVVSYDSLKTENDSINQSLFYAQSKVKDLLVEVQQVKKASVTEVMRYREQVSTLKGVMRDFVVQIDSLNRRNKQLMAENLEVKEQYSAEQQKNEELEKEKQQLEQKVKRGQILEAMNLTMTGLSPRDRETLKVAKTQKLRVNFTLSKNLLAKRGDKDIYLRIQRPDGLLLESNDNGTFRFEDSKIPYSAKRAVIYEGKELPVNIYWDNSGKPMLDPGKYTVYIFADGFNIGEASIILRK